MWSHPDADAFVRAILAAPAEVTTRLAFADWLEETGEPSDALWAQFIRLSDEASRIPLGERRRDLERRLAEVELHVRTTLTLDAADVLGRIEQLSRLLPLANVVVRLDGHESPRMVVELVPESVARENLVLPLRIEGHSLAVATPDPANFDTLRKLEFILNIGVIALRAEAEEVRKTLNRLYGRAETESVDSILVAFDDVERPPEWHAPGARPADATDAPVVRLVNLMITEAIDSGATDLRILPTAEHVVVQYRMGAAWLHRDAAPARLWPGVASRIAILANILIEDLRELRPGIAGVIPLRHGDVNVALRVTTTEQVEGVFIEIETEQQP